MEFGLATPLSKCLMLLWDLIHSPICIRIRMRIAEYYIKYNIIRLTIIIMLSYAVISSIQ